MYFFGALIAMFLIWRIWSKNKPQQHYGSSGGSSPESNLPDRPKPSKDLKKEK